MTKSRDASCLRCGLVTLNAGDDGAHLYRSLGFTMNERAMRLNRPTANV
ncbi:hypothetical protein ACWIG3_32870 [Streptomyces celluloflavus]